MKIEPGQVAVVTGGASGIGLGIAEALAQRGAVLVLADVEADALDAAVERLEAAGASAIGKRTDVRVAAEVEALAAAALDRFGRVDVICNNAGVACPPAPMWEVPERDWEWVLSVNLGGVINGIRSFVPHLVRQGSGHVVNTASMAGLSVPFYWGPYLASKHAVVALSEALAVELGHAAPGVGVTVVCPGLVTTNIGDADRTRRPDPVAAPRELSRDERRTWMASFADVSGTEPIPASTAGEEVVVAIEADRLHVAPNGAIAGVRRRIDALLTDLGHLH